MLEVRVYHREDNNYTGQLPADKYGNDFDTVFNNTKPCNYLAFDGKGINLLDESLKFYEDDDFMGYTLPCLSNVNCEIKADYNESSLSLNLAPSLDAYPEKLTIQFYNACCKEIKIIYCNENGIAVKDETVSVKGNLVTHTFLRGYYRIYVQFTKTAEPYQYIRIESIIYGSINIFNKFTSHNLVEEINVLSDDLPINQFEASIVSPDPDNINFAKKDPLVLFSNGKYYGCFYITNIQRIAENLYDIVAQNSISLFESDLRNWETNAYGEINASEITSILENTTGINIDISQEINDELICGYHKDGTYRAALCELGFCLGQMIDGSRSDKIVLNPVPTEITSIITTADRRIIGDAIFKKENVYSTAIIEYQERYPLDVVEDELSSKSISGSIGDIVFITFDKPTLIITSGFNLVSSGFEIINATMSSYTVKLTSTSGTIVYVDAPMSNIKQVFVTNENAEFENIKKFDNFLTRPSSDILFNLRNENIKKYIHSRGKVSAKIRLRNEKVGDLIQIETAWDGIITGIITKMNIKFGYEDIANIEVLEWSL